MRNLLRGIVWGLAVIALWAGSAGPSRADVLYSTLGPDDDWNHHEAYVVLGPDGIGSPRPYAPAMPFMLGHHAILTSIDLPIGAGPIPGTNLFTVELRTDNAGSPGDVIESFSFSDLPGTFSAAESLSTAVSDLQPLLKAHRIYWLAVFPGADDTSGGWNLSSPLETGTIAVTRDGGDTWRLESQADTAIAAFRINGTRRRPAVKAIEGS